MCNACTEIWKSNDTSWGKKKVMKDKLQTYEKFLGIQQLASQCELNFWITT
jgi:hypothetical protein